MSRAGTASVSVAALAFNQLAETYDDVFTNSVIGRAQRSFVWEKLCETFSAGDRILELNCGTGEDALFLASRGVSVLACDASTEMITVAQSKLLKRQADASLEFRVLPTESLSVLGEAAAFDGALSNFSGLNCVNGIEQVAFDLAQILKPGAHALFCVSTRVCFWEIVWFLAQGRVRKAFRRISGFTNARVKEHEVPVFYPTIRRWKSLFAPHFRLRNFRAVGLFVPPSYVEHWARRHPSILSFLAKVDGIAGAWPAFRCIGDHVLLNFERLPV